MNSTIEPHPHRAPQAVPSVGALPAGAPVEALIDALLRMQERLLSEGGEPVEVAPAEPDRPT